MKAKKPKRIKRDELRKLWRKCPGFIEFEKRLLKEKGQKICFDGAENISPVMPEWMKSIKK